MGTSATFTRVALCFLLQVSIFWTKILNGGLWLEEPKLRVFVVVVRKAGEEVTIQFLPWDTEIYGGKFPNIEMCLESISS